MAPSDTTVMLGDEVIFYCKAPSGEDQLGYVQNNPTYTFYKANAQIEIQIQESSSDSVLVAADSVMFKAGYYTCSVEYSNGQVSEKSNSVHLVVNGKSVV